MSHANAARTGLRVIHVLAGIVVLFALPVLVGRFVFEAQDERAPSRTTGARTVLLVSLDGTTPRELKRFCLQSATMPLLSELSREATWFDRHWSQCNGTNAAVTSLLTGHYPRNHGVGSLRDLGRARLSARAETIATDLAAAGFRGFGAYSLPQLDPRVSGLERGFEAFDGPPFEDSPTMRPAVETVRSWIALARETLEGGEPVFGFLQLGDALEDGRPPSLTGTGAILARHLQPFRDALPDVAEALELAQDDPAAAFAELEASFGRRRGHPAHVALGAATREARFAYLDQALRELFAALSETGRRADAVVCVTGAVGRTGAGRARFDPERLNVPFLLRLPDEPRGQTVHALSRAIDVRATLLDALRLAERAADGTSLRPLIGAASGEPTRHLHEQVLFEDSSLGSHGAVDDFWLVSSVPNTPPVSLADGTPAPAPAEIPPVPRARLEATRAVVESFGRRTPVVLALNPGTERAVEAKLSAWGALWTAGEVRGRGAEVIGARAATLFEKERSSVRVRLTAPDPEHGLARLELGADRRAAPFRLDLREAGTLDESSIWIGDRTLDRVALPRVPAALAERWPADEEPVVHVAHESGRWFRIDVDGGAGRAVELLIALVPLGGAMPELAVEDAPELSIDRVPGRPDCAWVRGTTPLTVRVQRGGRQELALAAEVDGVQVRASRMRSGDRRFADAESVSLCIPDWMPGVHDSLEVQLEPDWRAPEPGALWLRRVPSRLYPPEDLVLSASQRAACERLGELE